PVAESNCCWVISLWARSGFSSARVSEMVSRWRPSCSCSSGLLSGSPVVGGLVVPGLVGGVVPGPGVGAAVQRAGDVTGRAEGERVGGLGWVLGQRGREDGGAAGERLVVARQRQRVALLEVLLDVAEGLPEVLAGGHDLHVVAGLHRVDRAARRVRQVGRRAE